MASTDSRPVPIKNVAYRAYFGIFKNDGTLITGAAGLDSEVSKDGGTFADCTNEATEVATSSGIYYLDLTSTEMNADSSTVLVKSSSTDAVPVVLSLYPQESGDILVNVQGYTLPVGAIPALGIIENGTLQSATSSTAVLRSATSIADDLINNVQLEITGGTGAGQQRVVIDWVSSTDTATVSPNWTTTPDNTSTYIVRAMAPSPTAAGSLPPVNVGEWLGTTVATPSVAGVPEVDLTHVGGATTNVAALATNVDAILTDTGTTLDGKLNTIDDFLDTEIAALTTAVADIPTNAELATVLGTADDATLAAIAAVDAKIDTIDNFLDTEVAAILADTNELQTDWANGGRLDLILDARASQTSVDTVDDFLDTEVAAIKAKTDQLTFGVANTLNANITYVNEIAVTGDGETGTEWGPV